MDGLGAGSAAWRPAWLQSIDDLAVHLAARTTAPGPLAYASR